MSLTIGQLAKLAGVRVDTVRYYERRGMIATPPRRQSGYRDYPDNTVEVLVFIKRAQKLGFTLDEISGLIALRDGTSTSCDEVRQQAEHKVADIDERIAGLTAMRSALSRLVKSCREDGRADYCPILESLSDV